MMKIVYRAYIRHGDGWAKKSLTSATIHRDGCYILNRRPSPGQNRHILTVVHDIDVDGAEKKLADPIVKSCRVCIPERS
jgi:hypothetical protein